jgi:histidinol-phosphatase (PHP family)
MIDYHIHTNHSIDAQGDINEYCARAVEVGLEEICITNHCELDPQRDDTLIQFGHHQQAFTHKALLRMRDEIMEAKEKYKKRGLTVKFGLEIGYFDGIENHLQKLLHGVELDFLLGSIHCLDSVCIDSSKECTTYFTKYAARELLDNYYSAIKKLIESHLFDSIGHLDVYKKYGLSFYGDAINIVPRDVLTDVFRLTKENNIAFEINTAGFRLLNEFYPARSIIQHARDCGVSRITIGSDAHKVTDLGVGLQEGVDYAKSFGFDAVYAFEKRKPVRVKI